MNLVPVNNTLNEELNTLQETHAKSQREMQRLRQHLIEAEAMSTQENINQEVILQEYKYQIEGLVSEKETWRVLLDEERESGKGVRERMEECADILQVLKDENGKLKIQVQNYAISMGNLEGVLEAFQKGIFCCLC